MSGTTLRRTQWRYAKVIGADLSNTRVYASLTGSDLSHANLQGAKLYSNLNSVSLSGANLSDADLTSCSLIGTNFSDATVTNTRFDSESEGMYSSLQQDLIARGAVFDN